MDACGVAIMNDVLWRNVVALNASLVKENAEQRYQLVKIRKQLEKEIEKTKNLRQENEGYRNELMKKNKKINLLSSKLDTISHLVSNIYENDDNENDKMRLSSLMHKQNAEATDYSTDQNTNIENRKMSQPVSVFTVQERIHTEISPISSDVHRESNKKTDDLQYEEENLLTPLLSKNQAIKNKLLVKKVCNECDLTFSYMHSFKRHKALHTGLRPFACPKCVATFTRADHLKKHFNRKHGDYDLLKNEGLFLSKQSLTNQMVRTNRQ